MNSNRKTAIITGVFFIIGTVSGVTCLILLGTIIDSGDYLTKAGSNSLQIIFAAFSLFIMGTSCAGIGISLYPVLKKFSPGLAFGSAGFRLLEGMFSVLGFILLLSILSLSQEFIKTSSPDIANYKTAGFVLLSVRHWTGVASVFSWCIGALMYYWIFYKTRLVPLWLSIWGIAGIILSITANSLDLFGIADAFSNANTFLNIPIALQEMVLAVWLIVKGFNQKVIDSVENKKLIID